MNNILRSYVDKFNKDDNECYKQDIENTSAASWMAENVPLIQIPDKTIEEIYYFRWWTFRKHVKNTEDGYVLTEFLAPVAWGGKHNTIIAPVGHHVSEGKWLKCGDVILKDYLKFWLEEKSNTYWYSTWLLHSVYELCSHINDFSFGMENLYLLIRYYEKFEADHLTGSGLFKTIGDFDAMEFSISGVPIELDREMFGLRPTLNSYMAAGALAISRFAEKAGKADLSREYYDKYVSIKDKMTEILWDGTFYKAIHTDDLDNPSIADIPPSRNVKELVGYIPWAFGLAPAGFEEAFEELKLTDGFKSEYGLTTAERRHPRYLYPVGHECLWNGYIWPFATSQTLSAVNNLLRNYNQNVMTKDDFYDILYTYAESQHFITPDGRRICWIDEVKDPETNEWSSRKVLEEGGWDKAKGGFERGKDYNHSTFCDIVLGGLLGIASKDGEVSAEPMIPDDWDYFRVDNLWICGKCYEIVYDKNGDRYGLGKGITILPR